MLYPCLLLQFWNQLIISKLGIEWQHSVISFKHNGSLRPYSRIFRPELLPSKSKKQKSKAIPVTGCGALWGCEMFRIPRCLDIRLTDGGKVVSLTHRPRSTPQKLFCLFMFPVLIPVRG
jgi:hypothetical protein